MLPGRAYLNLAPPCSGAFRGTGKSRLNGFTLFELLVSMIIIGIVLSLAVISLPSDSGQRRLQTEAERLLALLKLARQEAILHSSPTGFRIAGGSYGFQSYEEGEWRPLDGGGIFRERLLPAGTRFELDTGTDRGNATNARRRKTIDVVFWPSGEMNAFSLILGLAGTTYFLEVSGTATGELKLTRPASG